MKTLQQRAALALATSMLVLTACKPAEPTAADAAAVPAAPAAVAVEPTPVKKAIEVVPVCNTCGTVRSITPVAVQGTGTGLGAVIGGIAGGLAGNQIGGGSGKKIATVAGVVGGAVAGNAIEKNRNASQVYDITVALENGSTTTITVPDASGIAVGSKVSVENGNISLR
ncbi:MAG: glycine zipper 2TM domain-containing protein [Pseudomonadota bacterium]